MTLFEIDMGVDLFFAPPIASNSLAFLSRSLWGGAPTPPGLGRPGEVEGLLRRGRHGIMGP
jgi:hypothetical protein